MSKNELLHVTFDAAAATFTLLLNLYKQAERKG